jgi:D-alanine-D-alanine ligase
VLGAIDRDAWNVLAVGITRDGRWTLQSDDPAQWTIRDGVMPEVDDAGPTVLLPRAVGESAWRLEHEGLVEPLGDVTVAFPLLHGPWGEDGTLQGAFELVDVRYVGAGVLASAMGMDKQYMKAAFRAAGLPVTPDVVLAPGEPVGLRRAAIEALGLPVFVKPARAGSSMGISRVDSWDALEAAVADAVKHDPKVLIEAAVAGREIETAVLGARSGVRASPPGEIITGGDHSFYDFDAKYLDESHVQLACPADLPTDVALEIQDVAKRAFAAVSAEGIARVDVFLGDDGAITVNEINTMPGFTTTSMYPRMWASGGVSYPELVEELLQAALARPLGLR